MRATCGHYTAVNHLGVGATCHATRRLDAATGRERANLPANPTPDPPDLSLGMLLESAYVGVKQMCHAVHLRPRLHFARVAPSATQCVLTELK